MLMTSEFLRRVSTSAGVTLSALAASSVRLREYASTRMPNARPTRATGLPTLPKPRIPRVFPRSGTPGWAAQPPCRIRVVKGPVCQVQLSSSAIASSEGDLPPGSLPGTSKFGFELTTITPRSAAALSSRLSFFLPLQTMIFRRGSCSMISRVSGIRSCLSVTASKSRNARTVSRAEAKGSVNATTSASSPSVLHGATFIASLSKSPVTATRNLGLLVIRFFPPCLRTEHGRHDPVLWRTSWPYGDVQGIFTGWHLGHFLHGLHVDYGEQIPARPRRIDPLPVGRDREPGSFYDGPVSETGLVVQRQLNLSQELQAGQGEFADPAALHHPVGLPIRTDLAPVKAEILAVAARRSYSLVGT